ncbi:hypothetical protein D3C80_1356130 [compost metagenome]
MLQQILANGSADRTDILQQRILFYPGSDHFQEQLLIMNRPCHNQALSGSFRKVHGFDNAFFPDKPAHKEQIIILYITELVFLKNNPVVHIAAFLVPHRFPGAAAHIYWKINTITNGQMNRVHHRNVDSDPADRGIECMIMDEVNTAWKSLQYKSADLIITGKRIMNH